MKCKCGADYEVHEHGLGYSIRCKNWEHHKEQQKFYREQAEYQRSFMKKHSRLFEDLGNEKHD